MTGPSIEVAPIPAKPCHPGFEHGIEKMTPDDHEPHVWQMTTFGGTREYFACLGWPPAGTLMPAATTAGRDPGPVDVTPSYMGEAHPA